jgi:hypothetical protein
MLCDLYRCICCPDPCYEPRFVPLANAAFFTDSARPATQIRLRGDFGWGMTAPDKAEWFWAQEKAKGPKPCPATGIMAQPQIPCTSTTRFSGTAESRLDYNEGFLYTEGARGNFGAFVELAYRNVDPLTFPGASGFGDMNLGTKSLILDCELIQVTFQFKTFLPTGNFTKGLGTGHVSLEPSLLMALKLTPETYLQGQLAYWFPIGGTTGFEGPVFHYHLSLNHLLCCCGQDVQLIGTAELSGYEILGGAFTTLDAVNGTLGSARDIGDILYLGPGVRLSICNKIDIGVGSAFVVTTDRLAAQLVRAEFRWRF